MKFEGGFTLIEMLMVTVVMSIVATLIAQFGAFAFGRQASLSRQTQSIASTRGNLNLLERDLTLTGFGQPLGSQAAYPGPTTHPNADELVLVGGPLVGPRNSTWTYVLQPSIGATLTVRCFGRDEGGTVVPDKRTDVVVAGGENVPVQILNFAGQLLSTAPRAIVATSTMCSQPGVDVDGDGASDYAMELSLDDSVSVPVGAIIVPMKGYAGVTDATVRYFVFNDKLWRENSSLPAVPLLDNVESFQVQYGWAATEGTQISWDSQPPWHPDRRLRAIRYHIVVAENLQAVGGPLNQVTALDATYDVPAGREAWERSHFQAVVRTPNTNFAHP